MRALGAHAGYPKQRIDHHFGWVNGIERTERTEKTEKTGRANKKAKRSETGPTSPPSLSANEHAEGGTRTRTGLRPLRPERSASTSFTTSARAEKLAGRQDGVNLIHCARLASLVPGHRFDPVSPRVDATRKASD